MTWKANLGTQSFTDKQVGAQGHGPFSVSWSLKADQGSLDRGALMALDENDVLVPYEIDSKTIGTGNGTNKTFAATLDQQLIQPGSVVVTDEVETFSDDGSGNLIGDAAGTGTINYVTGAISVTFNTAPTNTTPVVATSRNIPFGVLAYEVDTSAAGAAEEVGVIFNHGTVKKEALLMKNAAGSFVAIDEVASRALIKAGIYPL
jgi:hypothetical protein